MDVGYMMGVFPFVLLIYKALKSYITKTSSYLYVPIPYIAYNKLPQATPKRDTVGRDTHCAPRVIH